MNIQQSQMCGGRHESWNSYKALGGGLLNNMESHHLSVTSIKTQVLGEFLNIWAKHF